MSRKVLSVLFAALFVFVVVNVASAQDATVEVVEAVHAAPVAAAPCSDCVVPCGVRCCAPSPCFDPCYPPVVGYRRGFFGFCRPVYAPVCDPCSAPVCPPRFYRPWRAAYCCW